MGFKWNPFSKSKEPKEPLPLEQYEAADQKKLFGMVSKQEAKLLAIAGTGFLLDSYDLFIINLVTPIISYLYWGGLEGHEDYPSGIRGLVNAGTNIGNILGQLLFGFLGDFFGRQFVYGKEMMVVIIATILLISLPDRLPTPLDKSMWLFTFRVVLGIGIGGDYPMSASITSEQSLVHRRGALLAWIFSNQGWGTLIGCIATLVILACYRTSLEVHNNYHKLDGVWRIQFGIALLPAFLVLIPRMRMKESKQFKDSKNVHAVSEEESNSQMDDLKKNPEKLTPTELAQPEDAAKPTEKRSGSVQVEPRDNSSMTSKEPPSDKTEQQDQEQIKTGSTFIAYFSEWRHLRLLLGAAISWFLLDIAFYGVNLNQSVILNEMGFNSGKNQYRKLQKNAIGNLIIAIAGYVPGYWVSVFLIERMGRKWIQIQGFAICSLLFAVLAGKWHTISTAGRFVCIALAQFFFNFGPNTTSFVYPAEVFPSRVRAFSHGICAACGKAGAILSGLLFNKLTEVIGFDRVLWIFFACMILGIIFSLLLPETAGRDADLIDRLEIAALQEGKHSIIDRSEKWAWWKHGI
ncbi:plasma membrane inorganic phosphate transmembrane transporter Pho843 [Schizosaccharomyces osmophilus]|uniref:Plasma membrane inorganic phosphate transmembrane transporter Pho843 n=1 Tax=Schizosaccharomyces osmophilus TaxID=2545709 RepID=A0AAE9WEV2_9SCHI|nr:plasma membrane inorganic phosphate transmembrane transporter Pho843 [Schizosaccharomyces osmophilus]WBW74985.1 plasma membrane inorganic phosphate transmembrane transporter Pho843 [Schizosaccharomyces osmophilus]